MDVAFFTLEGSEFMQNQIAVEERTRKNVLLFKKAGNERIRIRLKELDQEWDLDRALLFGFSVMVIPQLWLGRKNKKWLGLPLIQTSFLLMQSTYGWCPPAALLRWLGLRTKYEIRQEREALLEIMRVNNWGHH